MADVPDRIEREIMLPVPVERVWAALTDPAGIAAWFCSGAEIDLRPGGAMTFLFGAEGSCPAIIEAVDPMRRFAYWWKPGSEQVGEVPADNRTLVDFTLEAVDGGTRLRLVESGFASIGDAHVFEQNDTGWDEELPKLRSALLAA